MWLSWAVALLLLLWIPLSHLVRRRELKIDIQRLPALIHDGHYVAALGMVDRHLRFFPEHVDLIATQQRILDVTKGDPEAAQRSFVAAQRQLIELRTRMENSAWLTPEERQSMRELVPYNPELERYYHQLLEQESEAKQIEEQRYKKDLQTILSHGNTPQTIDALQSLAVEQPQMQELKALGLLQAPLSSGPYLLTLGKCRCVLHLGQSILCGRAVPELRPDIETKDTRISRRHASINWEGEQVWAEDLESTRGLFINGERITSQQLHNGDTLDLGGAVQFEVALQKSSEGSALWLFSKDETHILIQKQAAFSLEKGCLQPAVGPWTLLHYQQGLSLSDGESLSTLVLGTPHNFGSVTVQIKDYV